jgi:diphthine-ammonia ligase
MGLTVLAYLWQREETRLVQDMLDAGMDILILKTAALGLGKDHVGVSLRSIYPHLLKIVRHTWKHDSVLTCCLAFLSVL